MGESFAELLKRHRIAAGLSQEGLAERSGVSVDTISALERGARRAPYKSTLDSLIEFLVLDDASRNEMTEAAKAARVRGPVQRSDDLPGNLPLQLTSFVNRETELVRIKELLASNRLVTLVGAGGAGKTRCAIEVATEVSDGFLDGVWIVDLAPISDPSLVAGVIARTMRVQGFPHQPILNTLLSYLRRKRLLLILDNCEQVIVEASQVGAAILHGCPGVTILATSRERFAIAGEQAYRVPSLDMASSIQLFTDRAVSADNRFSIAGEGDPYVADVCRRLDGIPLAIELAAARVLMLSPRQLARRINERFNLLTGGDRGALPRHRTMSALIDWSYDLLVGDERRLFRRLSIFAGGFSLEMADSVCRDETTDNIAVLDRLSSLVDKSLVQVEFQESTSRYRLLETTRQYAREKLVAAGEYDAAARAHAKALLIVAEELERDWNVVPERAWLAQAGLELENFRAALHWTLRANGDVELGQRLTAALRTMWAYLAPAEGLEWVRAAKERVNDAPPPRLVAELDLTEAALAVAFSQHKVSLALAKRCIDAYLEMGEGLHVAYAQRLAGQALLYLGDVEQGESLISQALTKARLSGSPRFTGYVLESLGSARRRVGDAAGARSLLAEALANYRAAGAERASTWVGLNLAETEFQNGNAAEALRLTIEVLDSSRALNDSHHVTVALCNATAYLTALERYDEARKLGREALVVALEGDLHYDICVAWVLQHLAAIAALQPAGESQDSVERFRAARLLGYADARFQALESPREYTEQYEYDKALAELHAKIGEEQLVKLMREGGVWSEDRAVSEAKLIGGAEHSTVSS